jgi:hypothetical protein
VKIIFHQRKHSARFSAKLFKLVNIFCQTGSHLINEPSMKSVFFTFSGLSLDLIVDPETSELTFPGARRLVLLELISATRPLRIGLENLSKLCFLYKRLIKKRSIVWSFERNGTSYSDWRNQIVWVSCVCRNLDISISTAVC